VAVLLVVDDEPRIGTLLDRSLSAHGPNVVEASDSHAALKQLDAHAVDLVLLDLVMPGRGGFYVPRALKERGSSPPAIVLTAASDIAARSQALDRGAIDVVIKPFSTAELSARVRRHLHPGTSSPAGEQRYLEAGGFRLDPHSRRAVSARGSVRLTPREFALLAHLMSRRDQVFSREELLHDLWGPDSDLHSKVVDVCVASLRWRLRPDPPIRTLRGNDYSFFVE
jgi:DNA-binding response OmpR family regulator